MNIDTSHGEYPLVPAEYDEEDLPPVAETRNHSGSSSTMQGEDSTGSSGLSLDGCASHLESGKEKEITNGSDSEGSTGNYVALRPLCSAAPQPILDHSRSSVTDMSLTQRSTRKGHRKSRQGCYNCKRRKIKCQETLPSCDNCVRKELVCKYPLVKPPSLLQTCPQNVGSPLVAFQLKTTPAFSLVDMRLFHHFLFDAYPHLPVGNDAVWVRRVPAVAYQHDYLMHALLGLAASHLTVISEADYGSLALSHRLQAIKGFNEALSKTPRSASDGDALLAACYALTFQSSYMNDGMSEFLTMVRGCGLVSFQLACDKVDVSFSISPSRHVEFMESRLDNLPMVDADLYEGAEASFHALEGICKENKAYTHFHSVLQDCAETVGTDSRKGYYKFIMIYQVLGKMEHDQFQLFSTAENDVSQVLLAHFVALEIMMAPILGREWKGRLISTPMEGILQWLKKIFGSVQPDMRAFLNWPESLATRIKSEVRGERAARPWLRMFFRRQT